VLVASYKLRFSDGYFMYTFDVCQPASKQLDVLLLQPIQRPGDQASGRHFAITRVHIGWGSHIGAFDHKVTFTVAKHPVYRLLNSLAWARWVPNLTSPYVSSKSAALSTLIATAVHHVLSHRCCILTEHAAVSGRAFRQEEKQTKRNADLVDKNIIMSLLQMSMNRCRMVLLRPCAILDVCSPTCMAEQHIKIEGLENTTFPTKQP